MRPSPPTGALMLLALLTLPGATHACELTYDETWKIWRGDCALTIDRKGPTLRNEVAVARTTLKLPDLLVDKLKFRLLGNQVDVYADITNAGTGSSPATTVVLNVTMSDPAFPMATTNVAIGPAMVPSLASQATLRVFVGTVTADHSVHDVDLLVNGMVDPVTVAQPVRGHVYELVESNNAVSHLCRVYGPMANVSLEPCN